MQTLRQAEQRGYFKNDWLESRHSFSFGEYHDPEQMGVSVLRVINEDRVIAGAGFPTHPHNNMEIISYVLAGELAHQDSLGNGSTIRPGDVQLMSAGTGVSHSEFNPSDSHGTHFLQIWLLPNQQGVKPNYAQKHFADSEKQQQLRLLVSPDGQDGSLKASTDAMMYGSLLNNGERVEHTLMPERIGYIHVASGEVEVNGEALGSGDSMTIDSAEIKLIGINQAEVLLFDLPKT